MNTILSPWAIKRLKEVDGDIRQFRVAKLYPSKLEQICVAKTEPGDDNNQDISSLVGKTDIRKLEYFSQNDPDAYSYGGGLNRTTQGLLEFVEMFKAPIKVLHPLLTATQEGNYMGTEAISAMPFNGIVVAHSNEAEWQTFKNNKNNEAFIDRICVIKIPYCLRRTEEQEIYKKMLEFSDLATSPIAPETLKILAQFSVLSRLSEHPNSNAWSKMRVYDGENIKETDPKARSLQEYRDDPSAKNEGMSGISTRFAFKILSQTFNYDAEEVSADPVHLLLVLENSIKREQFPADVEERYMSFIKTWLIPEYAEFIGNEIQQAYLEAYSDYGQNLFDNYISYADHWMTDTDYKDPDTGNMYDKEILNNELEKTEKAANISNPKDFRNEVVNFVLRQRAAGKRVDWTSYEKLRKVIEKKMFGNVSEMLPVISFTTKSDKETEKKHSEFVDRMVKKGYSERQTRRLVDWFLKVNKSG